MLCRGEQKRNEKALEGVTATIPSLSLSPFEIWGTHTQCVPSISQATGSGLPQCSQPRRIQPPQSPQHCLALTLISLPLLRGRIGMRMIDAAPAGFSQSSTSNLCLAHSYTWAFFPP